MRAGDAVEEGFGHASRDAGGRGRGELVCVLLRDRRLREGTVRLLAGQRCQSSVTAVVFISQLYHSININSGHSSGDTTYCSITELVVLYRRNSSSSTAVLLSQYY